MKTPEDYHSEYRQKYLNDQFIPSDIFDFAKKYAEYYHKEMLSKRKDNIQRRKNNFTERVKEVVSNEFDFKVNDSGFIEYWTEHGENDRLMRFEKEKSFSISRRLNTWIKRSKQYNTDKKPKTLAEKMRIDYGINS